MKEFFIGFLLGILLTAATGAYFVARKSHRVQHAQDVTAVALQRAADAVEAKLVAWHLTGDDIEKELTATGKVVRRQMGDFGAAVADAAGDAKITGKIKAKLALDKELSALGISVSTTEGRVTLSGNVTSSKQISRAMMLALETDGVREVSSTLHVKPSLRDAEVSGRQ
jgi:hyperosmotically inducible protein